MSRPKPGDRFVINVTVLKTGANTRYLPGMRGVVLSTRYGYVAVRLDGESDESWTLDEWLDIYTTLDQIVEALGD
ncbi:MAG: hypothetical protein AB7L09_02040 [Nitrospira sp.]